MTRIDYANEGDHRWQALRRSQRTWWTHQDERRMVLGHLVSEPDEARELGLEQHVRTDRHGDDYVPEGLMLEVPAKRDVCGTCDGKGSHVNPSVDDQGLTARDFAEDPGFAEDYMRGTYDVPCYGCKGLRVVMVVDWDQVPDDLAATVEQALEAYWRNEDASAAEAAAERRAGC